MKRRDFVKSTLALSSLAAALPAFSAQETSTKTERTQFFELRVYTFKTPAQQQVIEVYWQKAAIPALNRLGIQPIGVFKELEAAEPTRLFVVIPYNSLDQVASVAARLSADAAYQSAGAAYLDAKKSDPAYLRYESSISQAFSGMKQLEVPHPPTSDKPRIFELRTYESHSEAKLDNKVLMFNSGEIPLMREVDLGPVFFGQTLLGNRLPNLVYMVSGESKEAHARHWKGFFDAPVWKKLIGDPQYKDNVSKVVSVFLSRCPGSQI